MGLKKGLSTLNLMLRLSFLNYGPLTLLDI